MLIDEPAMDACVAAVLIERGFPAADAMAYARSRMKPRPDEPVAAIERELEAVILTMHWRGLIKALPPMVPEADIAARLRSVAVSDVHETWRDGTLEKAARPSRQNLRLIWA
jgi:hypothetical protein